MARKQYPDDFKTLFGASTMGVSQVIATSVITGVLMLYLTDYAGLFTSEPGKAAAIGTGILVAGRVWDAVNDPLMGFLMDRSPRTKWGRFKPFAMVAIPLSTVLIIGMFSLPKTLPDWTRVVLMVVLYFAFDAVFTLMPFVPIIQSVSPHARVRTKLLAGQRVVTLIFAMAASSFMALAIGLGTVDDPNIPLATVIFLVPVSLLSMLGLALVKEGSANADEEKVGVRDVVEMVKTNRPLWISQLSGIFGGFVWNILFAASIYYMKYAFGAANFGVASAVGGLLSIVGILLGVFAVQPILRRTTPGQAAMLVHLFTAAPLAVMFVLNLAGPISSMPLYFGLMFFVNLGIGMGYLPGSLLTMECMDYNKYRVGKSLEGTLNSVAAFVQKLQGAMAAAVTGGILVAVGYDAVKYQDATTIPPALFQGLGFAMFAVPVICSLAAGAILLWYPLRHKANREEMYTEIGARATSPEPDSALVNAGEALAESYGLPVADEEKK